MGKAVNHQIWNSNFDVKSESLQEINNTCKNINELRINKTPFEFNFGKVTHVNAWSKKEEANGKKTHFGHHFFVDSENCCGV